MAKKSWNQYRLHYDIPRENWSCQRQNNEVLYSSPHCNAQDIVEIHKPQNSIIHLKKKMHKENELNCVSTMLQKLSKCEVKAAWYGDFSNLLPPRFYVKSNFGVIKRSKNAIFANTRGPEFSFSINLSNFSTPNLPNF